MTKKLAKQPPISHFAALPEGEADVNTRPMGLHELPMPAQFDVALDVVIKHHPRIAATITAIWGHKECGEYILGLIMNGGDGVGRNRIGFKPEVSAALMSLNHLHELKFVAKDAPKLNPFNLR